MAKTLRELCTEPWDAAAATSPLDQWYKAVRDIPIDQLPVGDLARVVRQRFYLDYVVPYAIQVLESEPLAGKLYEGELAKAVCERLNEVSDEERKLSKRLRLVVDEIVRSDLTQHVLSWFESWLLSNY